MEYENRQDPVYPTWENAQQRSKYGRAFGGLVLVAVGLVLLANEMGYNLPRWLFSWEMLLIVIGVYTGAKHGFQTKGWLVLVVIGGVFLIDDVFPDIHIGPLFWPIFIIVIGLFMVLTPNRHKDRYKKWEKSRQTKTTCGTSETSTTEDFVESVSVFGGIKKHIITKNFKGGDVTCFMGGAEINMSQADFAGKVSLDVTQVFGGTKIIVPPHWEIQSEMTAVFGGIEDKRPNYKDRPASGDKILVIRGTSVFGGIDIVSY